VELFCVDQLIMVEIVTEDEFTHFNFQFPTNKVAGDASVSGIEAVFQILRQLIAPPAPDDPDGFVWEPDALERAVAGLCQQADADTTSLEGAAKDAVIAAMTANDPRFLTLAPAALKRVTLAEAKAALSAQLQPSRVEVSVSGDFAASDLEALAARYLGSLPVPVPAPANANAALDPAASPALRAAALAAAAPEEAAALDGAGLLQSPFAAPAAASGNAGQAKHVVLTVPDSDPRALIHCSGVAPNKWGRMRDGTDVRTLLGVFPLSAADQAAADAYQAARYGSVVAAAAAAKDRKPTVPSALKDLPTSARRAQPLWPAAALSLAQEVLNRRLFSEVRERRGLTYDANFQVPPPPKLRVPH
jgi:hypothetical protein